MSIRLRVITRAEWLAPVATVAVLIVLLLNDVQAVRDAVRRAERVDAPTRAGLAVRDARDPEAAPRGLPRADDVAGFSAPGARLMQVEGMSPSRVLSVSLADAGPSL